MKRLICCLLLLVWLDSTAVKGQVVDTDQPYSYEMLKDDIIKLHQTYKNEIEVKKIGTSHFGRGIYAVKLGSGSRNIVIIGTHHGREWMTSMLVMKKLEMYADAYHKREDVGGIPTDILNDVSIWFIPMLNPDGVTIQQHDVHLFPEKHQKRLVRMNNGSRHFERWKANGLGVDLNRQYPAGWKDLKRKPNRPSYKFYKGKKPVQAAEVKALIEFIRKINPEIAAAYHSAGQEIFWSYYNGKNTKRDKKIAVKISNLTGYKLAKPPKQATGGGFTDWFITEFHRPALTIEISPLVGEKSPPLSVFAEEWNRNQFVGLTLANEAKNLSHN
nr:M14 family zinc carboxypeptidase [Neobacillus sp. Marseille-Q6967]